MSSDRNQNECQQSGPEAPPQQQDARIDVNQLSSCEEETKAEENENSDSHFVNEGFRRWEESRASWLNLSDESNSTARAAVPIEVDEIIDIIFSQRWRNPDSSATTFPQPIPLPQMVDILVDLWEAEGLDI